MDVLFASVEMSPLAKVGGLGDVAGSLPRALRAAGADVRVVMPLHASIDREKFGLRRVMQGLDVPWPDGAQRAAVWEADVRGVPVYFIEQARFFGTPDVYGWEADRDRFLFFGDAVLAAAPGLAFTPNVVHAQDWHTALLLTRLASRPAHPWARAGRVYTIHNLALQGGFDRCWAEWHGIGAASLAAPPALDPAIAYSAMAQGILHAHRVNTVSATYAREILTPEYGAGLEVLLRARGEALSGIVNGIDYEEFDPARDGAIGRTFDAGGLDGRAENRRALLARAGLPESEMVPVFGVVTRLFAQKGIDLVAAAFDALLAHRQAQLVVLGTGDPAVHDALTALEKRYPRNVKVWLEFNPPLGQQIYAGCDVFMMPSRYEPCGLGQLISLRYGAVPLVRRTGGLADTVVDGETGFVFERADADDLRRCVERAIEAFGDRAGWRAMQERGMRQDWSWGRAAGAYLALYETAAADARGPA